MDDTSPLERLEEAIEQYFNAEKQGGMLLIGWSVLGLLVAACLFFLTAGKFENGVFYPVAMMAVLHLLLGGNIYALAKKRVVALRAGLSPMPRPIIATEQARMEKMQNTFAKYQMVEMLVFFLGFAFIIGGAFGQMGDFALGTGVGLTLQAAFTLVYDLFAAYRAGFYSYELSVFLKKYS